MLNKEDLSPDYPTLKTLISAEGKIFISAEDKILISAEDKILISAEDEFIKIQDLVVVFC